MYDDQDVEDALAAIEMMRQGGGQPQQQMDPRVEQMVAQFEYQQAEQNYEAEMQRIQSQTGINPELLHPFVSAADGDFDDAVEMIARWVDMANSGTDGAPPADDGQGWQPPADPGAPDSPTTIRGAIDQMLANAHGH